MRKNNLFTIIFILLLSVVSYPQTTNTKVKAKVEYEENDGIIKITGTAENLTGIVQSMLYFISYKKKPV
jgi:uncharacterized protein YpmS